MVPALWYSPVVAGKTSVLVSGGVESAALVAWALERGDAVFPVFVRSGHAWERSELAALRRLLTALRSPRLKPLSILELPVADVYRRAGWSLTGRRVPGAKTPDEAVYLPGRNLLLLSKAAVFAAERGIDTIALGTLNSNPFPDAHPGFLGALQGAASRGLGVRLRIKVPFARLHKPDVIARYPRLPWGLTFSCMAPRASSHCGRCNKCAERRAAFRRACVPDRTRYA